MKVGHLNPDLACCAGLVVDGQLIVPQHQRPGGEVSPASSLKIAEAVVSKGVKQQRTVGIRVSFGRYPVIGKSPI